MNKGFSIFLVLSVIFAIILIIIFAPWNPKVKKKQSVSNCVPRCVTNPNWQGVPNSNCYKNSNPSSCNGSSLSNYSFPGQCTWSASC